jgi:hypothetical protein
MTYNYWNLDQVTRGDLRLLLTTLKEYSSYVLLDCPVFKPFGAAIDLKGVLGLAVADLEGQPELSEYRTALIQGFRGQAERGEIRAAGYAQQGRHQLPGGMSEVDVIWIRMECRTGVCGLVAVPYSLEGSRVSFGEVFIQRDEPQVWIGPGSSEPAEQQKGTA